jgi:hypothetical protein
MMIKRNIFAVALALAFQGAAAMAQQQPMPTPALGLSSVSDAELDRYIAKSNGVVGLLNSSLRGEESWNRYLSWVDVKRGPTGKERNIYGLYSVGSSAKDAIEKARQSASADPAVPSLDGATKDLASAFEKLVPILNETEAYYDRKDYLSDNMTGGQALHAKLVPAAMAFLAARARTNELQDQFKELLDRQQLAKIEKAEGKSVRWHVLNTMMQAKKAIDLMPDSPNRGADFRQFDAALATYGEAVRDFDNAVRESGKSTSIDSYPRDILGSLREMRDNIAKGRADSMTFSMGHRGIITNYNMMVSKSNAFR